MTQSEHGDEIERNSNDCWTPLSTLPEATEVDRQLVRATQAAMQAAASHVDELEEPVCCQADCSEDREPAAARRKSKSIGLRVRSLLRFVLNGSSSGGNSGGSSDVAGPKPCRRGRLNVSNSIVLNADAGRRKHSACSRRRQDSQCAEDPDNASNKQPPANNPALQSVEDPEPAAAEEQLEPKPQPSPKEQPPPSPAVSQYPPIERPKVFRGGPTTESHKAVQEMLFRECRIIPISTLYKKVALVPGRSRLFLSAPNNPRPNGSRMMYDIAFENARHHMDCNRDFARVGLQKICSAYCKPSQFRYVY